MNISARHLLRSALLSSAAAASLAAMPGLAHAQQAAPAKAAEVNVEEIVVTGSRIRRPELTSVQPLQVITTQRMEERGFTNVADAINDLPSSGVPTLPIGDQASFSTGRNFVNIFNLGTNRTLTLVNGRRFVGGNPASLFVAGNTAGQQVDLNVIPTGLIDRIETIQAGGSAVYGSDAIAGVINIVTRTEYDGVELDAQYGWNDYGDGETWRGRVIAGKKFLDDKLSVFGSYEYNETKPIAFADRPATARQIAFASNPANTGTADGIPGAILILNRRIPELTLGGLPFRGQGIGLGAAPGTVPNVNSASFTGLTMLNASGQRVAAQFAPDGTLVPYDPGTFYQATIASGGDGANLGVLTSLQSPVKRHVANAFLKYEITDNIRASAELLYAKFNAEEPFNQPIFNSGVFGTFGAASGPLRYSTANPFLTAQARAVILAQPTPLPADPASPGDVLFFLHRASVDVGSNKTTAEGETKRGVFALDGDFRFLDREMYWNAAVNLGESSGSFSSPNIIQSRFVQAVDVIRDPATGQAACRDPAARAAGCQPLNLFGLGAPSAAALAWVGVQFQSDFKILQADYEASFGGDIVQLPGGMAKFDAGYEYRNEKSDFNPNDPQEAGVGRSAAISALAGKFNTSEYFGEISVPIFGDDFTFPLLHSLEFDGQYRHVDHSRAGEDEAWSYGGRWYPVADLLVRAQKSRSFRSPAITELFLPNATSFTTATDPCDARNITSGPNPSARQANCQAAFQALGLPANFSLTSQVQAATVQGSTSGNPNLKNEIADQQSFGFVYQPHFIPGLAIHADYVKINLTSAIFNFNLTSILQVCYDSPSPPADACGRFQRGTSASAKPGQILGNGEAIGNGQTATGPQSGFVNAGYINFEGLTAGVNYRIDLDTYMGGTFSNWLGGKPGRLSFDFELNHTKKLETSVTGLGFDLNRDQGEIGNSNYEWKLDTEYRRGPLTVLWTVNWKARAKFNNDFTLETRYPLKVDDYFLNDLSILYDLDQYAGAIPGMSGLQARFIVKNVGDVEPPFGTTAAGVYDLLGRYYYMGLRARF
jgi:outer membrane receptor protein involved in Fe transport